MLETTVNWPTNEEARRALEATAERRGDFWYWADGYPHSEESALAITAACLYLCRPVTDTVTGMTWAALVHRVAVLAGNA